MKGSVLLDSLALPPTGIGQCSQSFQSCSRILDMEAERAPDGLRCMSLLKGEMMRHASCVGQLPAQCARLVAEGRADSCQCKARKSRFKSSTGHAESQAAAGTAPMKRQVMEAGATK